jgi:chorismate mutase / prephenate dehydratase
MTDPALERLREQVAATDREILELVNRRLELVGEIRAHKAAHGLAFVDPGQEGRLLARLRDLNGGPLSADGVERLFRELLDLVKTESADKLGRKGAEAAN